MQKKARTFVLGLIGLGATALLWAGCPVVVERSAEPTTAPPVAPVVSVTCGPNQYLRGGRHVWRNGAWQWVDPSCVARAADWRDGCRWTRGHWARSGNRYVFNQGRLVCPAAPVQPIQPEGPTAEPPAPPAVTITCGPNEYLRGGRHQWRGRRWVWVAPRCVARPSTWRDGCRWTRGGWQRVNGRLRYVAGRLFCPRVVPLAVVHPTWMPPERPPQTYRRPRCARGQRYYPGRYTWNNLARRYTWRPGTCIALRRGCRWVPGRWAYHNGRSYFIRPAWRCKGQLHYVGHGGSAWTPPAAYGGFMNRRPCRRGFYHNDQGRCVRFARRCPAGMILRYGRCFKQYVAKRCGRGWVLRAGRCVRPGAPLAACRPGFHRVGARCVRGRGPRTCKPGFALRAGRCVRVRGAIRCRPGTVLRGRRCVAVRKPITCRPGTVLRGRRCVAVRKPIRCRPGTVLRGGRCVAVRKPIRCRPGTVLRGGRCVPARRPGMRPGMRVGRPGMRVGRPGMRVGRPGMRVGRPAMRVGRPAMRVGRPVMRAVRRCGRGFVLRGGRCVKGR